MEGKMKKLLATCLLVVLSMLIVSTTYAASAQVSPSNISSNPMVAKMIFSQGEDSMKKIIEKMKSGLASIPIRTGRASVDLIEGIKVESSGTMMPLNKLANMSTPDAKTIEIRPWDISQLANIERAILKSNIGLTTTNDGKIIRLAIPSLTEDRRKEVIKGIHKISEEFRIAIRNERRQMVENIKKAEKEKKITEDERKKAEAESEKLTDVYMKKIDELLAGKEKEVMEV
jgi:ribosome recycling factor